jgi:FkbM family methyltransferase
VKLDTLIATTPGGNDIELCYRKGTADEEVIHGNVVLDEYRLGDAAPWGGEVCLDLGAYIGTAGIVLAMDNPGVKVVMLEPIQENAEIARANVSLNDLQDRVHVICGAIGRPNVDVTSVQWGLGTTHQWVGHVVHSQQQYPDNVKHANVLSYSLSDIVSIVGIVPLVVKMDVEGSEWAALEDETFKEVPRIVGEWHHWAGGSKEKLHELLGETHRLEITDTGKGLGMFFALRKEDVVPQQVHD